MKRLFLSLLLLTAPAFCASKQTPLDRYVAKPDPSYRYELVSTIPGDGYTAYVLDMTSQTWRTEKEVDKPLWRHWVTIIKPARVASSTGFLFITGGAINNKPPAAADPTFVSMAMSTNSVVAELRMVPNQPLTFAGETKGRSEDSMIVYSWDKFLRTGDETWPARLPMTKSAVRAMDSVTSFCKSEQGGGVSVEKFVVGGASKRGWTTWTTAAVDKRVVAIMPMVIDVLNMQKSMDHHFQAYGFWAPAIGDYSAGGMMNWTGTPEYKALLEIEEPFSYRERYTMPKFIVNSTGDQYFLPDSSQFYWDELKGEKHLRYVPNTNHSLARSDARDSVHAFYELVIAGKPRPSYTWTFEKDGGIRIKTKDAPSEVRLWQATNPKARDFRLDFVGPIWNSTVLKEEKPGLYIANLAKPEQGWTAFFVEMTYPTGGKYPLKVTSGVRVVPDTLPFPAPPKGTTGKSTGGL